MQFPIVNQYKIDLENINPENEIKAETKKVAPGVKTRVIAPLHAPFFVNSLKMRFANGQPMEVDKHFRIFRLMNKLTEQAGEPIACLIELLDNNITEVEMDYDTVGEFSLIDNSFLQLIFNAVNDDRPVWWNDIDKKPTVYPPTLHTHSLVYEVMAFQDVVELLNVFMGLLNSGDANYIEIRLNHYLDLINHYITVYGDMLRAFLKNHEDSYNSHGLTAVQVGLENVDNFETASPNEVLTAGNDKHLTPAGLKNIVDVHGFNSKAFLESNVMPFSSYGNTGFIPPSIGGSYEALGGSLYPGIVFYPNGQNEMIAITGRFDGRVRGLYYETIKTDDFGGNPVITYTGHKYDHPDFRTLDLIPDTVSRTSGTDLLVFRDTLGPSPSTMVSLSHSSLEPSNHTFSSFDDTLLDFYGLATIRQMMLSQHAFVKMGNWVYLFLSYGYYHHVWRFPVSQLSGPTSKISPTRVTNLTYTDCDGAQVTNGDVLRWGTPTTGKNFHTFDPNKGTITSRPDIHVFAEPINETNGIYLVKLASSYFYNGTGVIGPIAGYQMIEAVYEWNVNTNVLTLVNRSPVVHYTFDERPSIGNVPSIGTWRTGTGLTLLPNGKLAGSMSSDTGTPKTFILSDYPDVKNRLDMISTLWTTRSVATSFAQIEPITSPMEHGFFPRAVVTNNEGEYFTAYSKNMNTPNKLFFRQVTGKYLNRPGITNINTDSLLSRPLTNNVKEVAIHPGVPLVGVYVPDAQTATYGVEVGDCEFAAGIQEKYLNANFHRTENPNDILIISSHTRSVNANDKIEITPTTDILYPEAIVEQLKQNVEFPELLGPSGRVIVHITDPNGRLTNKFGWLPTIAIIAYGEKDGYKLHQTILTINPTYSTNGTRRTVTSVAVLHRKHETRNGYAAGFITEWPGYVFGSGTIGTINPPRTWYYLNGNAVEVWVDTGIITNTSTGTWSILAKISIPNRALSTVPTDANVIGQTIASGGGKYCMSPSGPGIAKLFGETGSVAQIASVNGQNYLLASIYPETGWTVFFQTDQTVVFNGVSYTVPAGSIDLRDVTPNPANKTFYIYVKLDGGAPKYEISPDKRQETPFQLWIGTIVTGANQISTIERQNVFAINGYRISENRCGGGIPASAGSINSVGQLPWLLYGDFGMAPPANPLDGLTVQTLAQLPNLAGWGSGIVEYNGNLYMLRATPSAASGVSSSAEMVKYNLTTGGVTSSPNPMSFGSGFFMVRIGEYIYVCGGRVHTSVTTAIGMHLLYRYNISNSQWTNLANMPSSRAYGACCVYNNKIYLVGGVAGDDDWTPLSRVDVYDVATNTWSSMSTTGQAYKNANPASILIGNKLLLIGGGGQSADYDVVNVCTTLNLDTGVWEDVRTYYDWTLSSYGGVILELSGELYYMPTGIKTGPLLLPLLRKAYLLGKPGRTLQSLPDTPVMLGINPAVQIGEAGYVYGDYDNTNIKYTNNLIKITL